MKVTDEINGVVAVYKPRGWTSFDVVAKLRGVLHTRKIGHGGTLDPMAEGVLPVFVGKATKACDILPDKQKGYIAGFRLGITTDTQDITGTELSRNEDDVSDDEVRACVNGFLGDSMQIPPMYSAVKIDGKRLYELAREGKTVERQPRPIHVDAIDVIDYDKNARSGHLTILCSKGTYVRTIIHDMGEQLGTGGVMTSLVRVYSGGLTIDDCMRIEEISSKVIEDGLDSVLTPLDRCFPDYPKVTLDEHCTKLYKNGVKLRSDQVSRQPDDRIYRVYGVSGFLGLGNFKGEEFCCFKNFF
ncbi:MAG: tRNA pseudouridine(55) synthase TruB [Ruminococcus sp.]|nr:tRNA pseudouridine(55) synthase TruB [Ruminococcus sp.]